MGTMTIGAGQALDGAEQGDVVRSGRQRLAGLSAFFFQSAAPLQHPLLFARTEILQPPRAGRLPAWLVQAHVLVEQPPQRRIGQRQAVVAVLFINRFVALCLLRLGWDPQTGWWDKLLGSLAGGALLYHFGNELASVVGYIAFAVLPELFRRKKKA